MVVSLNMILFTTKELHELRLELQNLATTVRKDMHYLFVNLYRFPQESWELFSSLYHCWCHNSVTTVALCLLSQNYEHASQLIEYLYPLTIRHGHTSFSLTNLLPVVILKSHQVFSRRLTNQFNYWNHLFLLVSLCVFNFKFLFPFLSPLTSQPQTHICSIL